MSDGEALHYVAIGSRESSPLGSDLATGELPAVTPPAVTPNRRRRRRMVVGGAAAVLAAGAGIGIWLGTGGSSPAAGLKFSTKVVDVTTGTIKETVSASGTLEPAQESNLDFAVSGKVTAVDATVGQQVAAGQTLATVAATALQADEAAAQASLTSAESKLSTDEADAASTSQLASDRASVTSAQAQLTTATKALADAALTSPIAGTVASVDLTVGQQVSGSGSGGTGSTGHTGTAAASSTSADNGGSSSAQVEVISTGTFVVNSTVDDTEVGKVAAGDQAVITPTGATTPVYGTVASVGMIASGSSGVASFPVVVDVTGTQTGIYAGSSASVSIIVKQLNNVVEVTTAAISYANGQATVTVVEPNGQHITRDVTVGTASGGETQITKGLSAGDKVLERVATFTPGAGARGGAGLFGGTGAKNRVFGGTGGGGRFLGGGTGGGGRFQRVGTGG